MTEAAKYIDLCSLIVKNPRFFKFFTNICLWIWIESEEEVFGSVS
jgi:hypothetical protein